MNVIEYMPMVRLCDIEIDDRNRVIICANVTAPYRGAVAAAAEL